MDDPHPEALCLISSLGDLVKEAVDLRQSLVRRLEKEVPLDGGHPGARRLGRLGFVGFLA